MADCARGCAVPCRCTECAAAGVPIHEPKRSPVGDGGVLCDRDERRLTRMLVQIRDELPDLAGPFGLLVRHTGERVGSYQSRVSASPALIRLDVLAMFDPAGMLDPETGLRNIEHALGGWAARLRDHLAGLSADDSPDDWEPWADWLINRSADLMRYPYLDDVYAEVVDLHRLVMRAAGYDTYAGALGRCLQTWTRVSTDGADPVVVRCEQIVYAQPGQHQVRCRRCGRTYSGVDRLRLKHQADRC